MCSTPEISASTCSIGEATRLSTCSAEAPGKPMKTLAKVTSICGSSSRGVTSTANTAQQYCRERQQWRELAGQERSRDAPAQTELGSLMSVRSRATFGGASAELSSIAASGSSRDAITCHQPRQDLDALAEAIAEPHLAHRDAPVRIDHIDGA